MQLGGKSTRMGTLWVKGVEKSHLSAHAAPAAFSVRIFGSLWFLIFALAHVVIFLPMPRWMAGTRGTFRGEGCGRLRTFTLRDVVWLTLNDISINLTYLQLDLLTSVCLSPPCLSNPPPCLSLSLVPAVSVSFSVSFSFSVRRHNECGPVNISTLRHLCWSAACSFLLSFEPRVVDMGCVSFF